MTLTAVIALFVFVVCIGAAAVLLANGIQDEPPATAAERKYWPGDEQMADVEQRRANGESWKDIAAAFGRSHTTLMNAVTRYKAARKVQR